MNNWKNLITEALDKRGETWGDVVACTLTEDELSREFEDGFGRPEGERFTVWTAKFVYYPSPAADYVGEEWCDSVPRNPEP
jgi:hypothetical protein